MSATHVSVQEMSYLYRFIYCSYAACAILIYDWFLCLGQEVRFIWNWHSKVTSASLVYALSRYAVLIQLLLVIASNYPMSDLVRNVATVLPSNRLIVVAVMWAQVATLMLGTIASSAFSALRAYALSNRNIWLTAIIILLALPPPAMTISIQLQLFDLVISNALYHDIGLAAELLVVGITWWYSYQSYRMRKGMKLGKTVSSLLIYNGSVYFLCLATLYILDIIFNTASVPDTVLDAAIFLSLFYDPITSILTCHFMLSLRRFDSSPPSVAFSETGSRLREHAASRDVLQFAAQPSDSLPAFIASFAGPVHVDSALSETDADAIDDKGVDWQEKDVVAPTRTTASSSSQSPAPEQPQASDLGHSV
ncbi:hypothetical protein LXA43DRAFT_1123682 [Ganoderma leucocontextum]|nr:hypothetical protein LXA43DRAFT_1123682 [Ganoderma leucocontextum]